MAARRASASSQASHDADNHGNPFNDDPNIFSDNYAESIAESFADSFDARSVNDHASARDAAASSPDTVIAPAPEAPRRPSAPSPWASTNPRGSLHKSMALGGHAGHSDEPSNTPSPTATPFVGPGMPTQRSASIVSSSSFARSQSPVQASSGPSHPYAMYPQALGMSRSPSVATTSTVRPPSLAPGRQGPTHPYTLYPQNVPEDSGEESSAIPVGFLGHGNTTFQRRLGPEGEVQDIIGPDGHSEQLPPYTRFAEDGAAKVTDALLAPVGESPEEPSSPEHALLFPRRPHNFDETQPEPVEQRRRGSERGQPTAYDDSDRGWKDLSWSEKKKQKVLGVPLWFFLVIMFSIVVIAAVSGGVIGGVLGRHQAKDDDGNDGDADDAIGAYDNHPIAEVTVTTTMIDAAEISSVPTALPTLPSGFFKVDVGEQTSTSQNCLASPDQRRAWSCSLNPDTFSLEIGFDAGNDGKPYITIENYLGSSIPQYGAQPPRAYGQTLKPATDLNNPDWGVAYQFQLLYDKMVVVDSDDLTMPTAGVKRDLLFDGFGSPSSTYARKQVAPTDEPWFCFWNHTLLEGFIYVENDTMAVASAAAAASLAAMPTPSLSQSWSTTADYSEPTVDYTVPYMTPPPASPTTGYVKHARPYAGAAPSFSPAWPHVDEDEGPISGTGRAYLKGDKLVVAERRDIDTDVCYPKRIKIEERRLWQAQPVSYCQKMTTNAQGQMVPLLDDNFNPIKIALEESDPQDQPTLANARRDNDEEAREVLKRSLPVTGCYCQWQAT